MILYWLPWLKNRQEKNLTKLNCFIFKLTLDLLTGKIWGGVKFKIYLNRTLGSFGLFQPRRNEAEYLYMSLMQDNSWGSGVELGDLDPVTVLLLTSCVTLSKSLNLPGNRNPSLCLLAASFWPSRTKRLYIWKSVTFSDVLSDNSPDNPFSQILNVSLGSLLDNEIGSHIQHLYCTAGAVMWFRVVPVCSVASLVFSSLQPYEL